MRETRDPEKPDIVFHYNRERRLANAPESVRRAYEEGPIKRPGIIRGLTASPGLRSIFFVIVLLSAIITGVGIFGTPEGYSKIDGIPVSLKALHFDEQVYFTLTFLPDEAAEAARIRAEVTALNESGMILDQMELDSVFTGSKLVLRGVFPDHGITRLSADIHAGNSIVTTGVSVDRK
jgi:hypothetical protein